MNLTNPRKLVFLVSLFILNVSFAAAQNPAQIKLDIDAGETPRNILHVRETMRVKPGPLTLFYPKWIPGEHTPTGTLNDMVNLFIKAGGKPLAWQRDDVEMFAFHCEIPPDVSEIEISFDDALQPGTLMSAQLGRIKWNRLFLYPRGVPSDDLRVSAAIKLPADWKCATALAVAREAGGSVYFKDVSLTRLVDSPAMIGLNFKKVRLSTGAVPHEMDIAGDTEEALEASPETIAGWKNLVREANLLFGARHYNSYHFLLTLSYIGEDEGLEHHESSEDGAGEEALTDQDRLIELADLLSHEYAHSWNGKYRRPAGLATADFEQPMRGDLLWVYEGLTQYLGFVLPSRSKLWTPEIFRETVAVTAAGMDGQSGRKWRPLVDTARAVQFTYDAPGAWMSARRAADYYDEGMLIWLEADVLIREKSKGRLSLDDFCRRFHGGRSTGPMVKPYDLDEVIETLNAVLPYDWREFFNRRVYAVNARAPLGGITGGGWKLIYDETPNARTAGDERLGEYSDLTYSIGCMVDKNGGVFDVDPDLSAGKAGLAPGMKIVSVNGADFSGEVLYEAITAAKTGSSPITLVAENGGFMDTYSLNYHGGRRYPHLARDTARPDILSAIIRPH
jgi:predicted metalloprotease with PDZ domain